MGLGVGFEVVLESLRIFTGFTIFMALILPKNTPESKE